jgi:hypothetical protein
MLAAAVRRTGCRREAGISDGRPATGVTPHWYGSAEAARPPGRRQAACQLQRKVRPHLYELWSLSDTPRDFIN